ncbi:uncharacterized protein LOC117940569 isoform X1 [Etheostoma cragini]|uniref:uncharacterized protein LOC117940569 isoform X1 n=1 Tax=Etheostoma cragini TaxID=417921 RepID=UPI00155F315F|nr:uncharacterized protein LOC117940569 isoform X1 [Etheostoma cragini]
MSLYLFLLFLLLLAGSFCVSLNDIPTVKVQQNTVATLPCPHKKGDVTWSRYRHGNPLILVTIKNGEEKRSDKRYGSLADNSLVISHVMPLDTTMYFCNKTRVFLEVITPPNRGATSTGNVPVAPCLTENQQPSGFWKMSVGVMVGVVVGAVLVLLVIFTLRFFLKKRTERSTRNDNSDTPVTDEPIYEEMNRGQPRWRDSYFESPSYWTIISEPPSTSTPPSNNLYSAVTKPTGCPSAQ